MKKIIIIFSLFVILNPITAVARVFVHPGINIDKTQLDLIKNKHNSLYKASLFY